MDGSAIITYPVPKDGHPPMSLPTEEKGRLLADEIKIETCAEADFVEWSLLLYEAFPQAFWDSVEIPLADGPSLPLRIKAHAKRWIAWASQPGFHAIKAVYARTGELMGVAGWHECGPRQSYPTSYATHPGVTFPPHFVPCVWRDDLISPAAGDELGIAARMGWSAKDVLEMTRFHKEQFSKEFEGYDLARLREVGDRYHWYLAPFAVWPQWQRRGVGGALLRWALNQADEKGWPVILEATPNARPVYYHVGFEPTEAHGDGKEIQLVRQPRKF